MSASEYISEYGSIVNGKWFYSQAQPGDPWYDYVDNSKGWTLETSIRIISVSNSDGSTEYDSNNGIGFYINDGTYYENILLYTQQIYFKNANVSIDFDTTTETSYRIIAKDNSLIVYAKSVNNILYSKIAHVDFNTKSNSSANSYKPSIIKKDNVSHAVWQDDSTGYFRIYYSKYENNIWSIPEIIVDNGYDSINPSISIDTNNIIYVTYENKKLDKYFIGLVYKNDISWSDQENHGNYNSLSLNHKSVMDYNDKLHIVWSDDRFGNEEIFYAIRDSLGNLKEIKSNIYEYRLTSSENGCDNPDIDIIDNNVYISYTKNSQFDKDKSYISITKYDSLSNIFSEEIELNQNSYDYNKADFSSIIVSDKNEIFVSWNDIEDKTYELFSSILNDDLTYKQNITRLTSNGYQNKYPKLSLNKDSGDIYITWLSFINENDPYDILFDNTIIGSSDSFIKVSKYDYNEELWKTSFNNSSSQEVKLISNDTKKYSYFDLHKRFNDNMDIIFGAFLVDSNSEYDVKNNSYFKSNIYYGQYDLSDSESYNLFTNEYVPEVKVSNHGLDKELRFGLFANNISANLIVKYIKYYLNDSVIPNEIVAVNSSTSQLQDFRIFDNVCNNYGDAWVGTSSGLYFYYNEEGSFSLIESGFVRSVNFDLNNIVYAAIYGGLDSQDDKIIYSSDYASFKDILTVSGKRIKCLGFDSDRNMFVGTNSGIIVYKVSYIDEEVSSDLQAVIVEESSLSALDNLEINSIQIDENNVIWIGTSNGLFRYKSGNVILFNSNNGLSSNYISDIAIKNKSVRYIATRSGVLEMIGSNFKTLDIKSQIGYSLNIKAIAYRDPNILWISTMSNLYQVNLESFTGEHKIIKLDSSDYTGVNAEYNDYKTYFIDTSTSDIQTIPENSIVEVYLNGNKINEGYTVSRLKMAIRFEVDLLSTDRVDITVRNDIQLYSSFYQTELDKNINGIKNINIKQIDFINDKMHVGMTGDLNSIKIIDNNVYKPNDQIILDTEPPKAKIDSVDFVGGTLFKVNIAKQTEDTPFDNLSGVDKMIISNYQNFTTDGETEKEYIDFATSVYHDIDLTDANDEKVYDFTVGIKGSNIYKITDSNDNQKIFLGTNNGAKLYSLNYINNEITLLRSFSENSTSHIDFISSLNNKIVVGVGSDSGLSKIYISNDSFSSFNIIGSLEGNRVYAAVKSDGLMYIGTSDNSSGRIYSFDGSSFELVFSNIGNNIYSLSSDGISLYAATGNNSRVFKCSLSDKSSLIIYSDSDTLVNQSYFDEDNQVLYIGTGESGKIFKTDVSDISFNSSFNTISSRVNIIKNQYSYEDSKNNIYAAVGKSIYKISDSGSWSWILSKSENILDFVTLDTSDTIYIITENSIYVDQDNDIRKTIYLKLKDKAENETSIYDESGVLDDNYYYDIDLQIFSSLINSNKLIEINSLGKTVFSLTGENKFYSGKRNDIDKGVYESEIFNGTNDIIRWDSISYNGVIPNNTTVKFYIKTASLHSDIELASYREITFNDNLISNLSNFKGQFIQFKIEMTSSIENITPSIYRVILKSINGESVHFFTTNFVLTGKVKKGILTSKKVVPQASDVIFGLNTTNSVDFADYQIIDEDRLEEILGTGNNIRVGIKMLTGTSSTINTAEDIEYGPYGESLFDNVVDFTFENNEDSDNFGFRISFYDNSSFDNLIYSASSVDGDSGFVYNNEEIDSDGIVIDSGEAVNVLFSPSLTSGLSCGAFYYVKIDYYNDDYYEVSNDRVFLLSCEPSFVDFINFEFTNEDDTSNDYHFRVRMYSDSERTNLLKTIYSGNDVSGWDIDGVEITESGYTISMGSAVTVYKDISSEGLEFGTLYYLIVDVFDGSQFILASNSYTFIFNDSSSDEYCGPYENVPIVKNFGLMFELDNGDKITLNK